MKQLWNQALVTLLVLALSGCAQGGGSSAAVSSPPDATVTADPIDNTETIAQFNEAIANYDYAKAYHVLHAPGVNLQDKELQKSLGTLEEIINQPTETSYRSYDVITGTTTESSEICESIFDTSGLLTYRKFTSYLDDGNVWESAFYYDYYPGTSSLQHLTSQHFENGVLDSSYETEYDLPAEQPEPKTVVTTDGNRRIEVTTEDGLNDYASTTTQIYENDRLISDEYIFTSKQEDYTSKTLRTLTYQGNLLVKEVTDYEFDSGECYTYELTYLTFDALGNPTKYNSSTSFNNFYTAFEQEFDDKGQRLYQKSQDFAWDKTPVGEPMEIWWEYDNEGRIREETYKFRASFTGTVTDYTYDAYGRVTTVHTKTYADGILTADLTTKYSYLSLD